jgi:hypothetical protein
MSAFETVLITTARCAGLDCPDCERVEKVLRDVAAARGIPVPLFATDSDVGLAAGIGGAGTIAVRHASCEEAAELLGENEPPVLLVNGRVVLSGPGWGEMEVRAAIRLALNV